MTRKPRYAPPITVAVLNHRRPHLLSRVLQGIDQLNYPNFEVVVVGDLHGLEAHGLPEEVSRQITYVQYLEPNIGRARNLALRACAGEFIAFIDDDAVPEPNWLSEVMRAFMRPDVGGVGGLVRGADGLSVEWQGGVFNRAGVERPMAFPDDVRAFDSDSQIVGNEFIGILGANSAFRVDAVQSVGGFDEAIRYYLDETDLMLRLAEAGWHSGLARTAEVHHLREENTARDSMRVPRNLVEIAASKAYFCKRHLPEDEIGPALERFRENRRRELDPFVRLGALRLKEVDRLLDQVEVGIADGLERESRLADREPTALRTFRRFSPRSERGGLSIAIVSGWGVRKIRQTRELALRLSRAGHSVSCFSFQSGPGARTVEFVDGIWLHQGGTWRLDHKADGRRCISRHARAAAEIDRVRRLRSFDVLLCPQGTNRFERFVSGSPKSVPGCPAELMAREVKNAQVPFYKALPRLAADLGEPEAHFVPVTEIDLPHSQPKLIENPTLLAGG